MSEPKFMHGPWHFAGSGIIANDDDEEIGLSAVYDDDPNGKLIIAAPEMYEALEVTADALAALLKDVEAMTDWTNRSLGVERKAIFANILGKARAALAKVTP